MKQLPIQKAWANRCKILARINPIAKQLDAINAKLLLLSKEFKKPYLSKGGGRKDAVHLMAESVSLSLDAKMFGMIAERNVMEAKILNIRSDAEMIWASAVSNHYGATRLIFWKQDGSCVINKDEYQA